MVAIGLRLPASTPLGEMFPIETGDGFSSMKELLGGPLVCVMVCHRPDIRERKEVNKDELKTGRVRVTVNDKTRNKQRFAGSAEASPLIYVYIYTLTMSFLAGL